MELLLLPDRRQLQPVLPETGPRHSGAHRRVPRVLSVSFDVLVTVYPVDDYDRRSPWMRTARQIVILAQNASDWIYIFAPILSCEHSCLILLRRLDMSSRRTIFSLRTLTFRYLCRLYLLHTCHLWRIKQYSIQSFIITHKQTTFYISYYARQHH